MAEGPSAEQRLSELGLSSIGIKEALLTGHAAGRQFGPPHPRSIAGLVAWSTIGAILTDQLAPDGWRGAEVNHQVRVFHPQRGTIVIPQSGDENVGNPSPEVVPTQRNPKGPTTEKVVELNYAASLLDEIDLEDDYTPEAWILLYRFDAESISAELSWPRDFAHGRVTSWAERILIPEIPFEGGENIDLGLPDDLPDSGYDFEIPRRTA
jgi:hypothetical protein